MRNTILKRTIGIFGMFVLTILLLACSNDIFKGDQQSILQKEKAVVSFSVMNSSERTVLPQVSLENVSSYKLFGGKTGETEIELLEFTKEETTVSVEIIPGTWNFTLNVYNENDELILQGKVQNQQISLTGVNHISFSLSVLSIGGGDIQITINFPEEAGITRIAINGDIAPEEFTTISNGNFVYTKNGIAVGDYFINFELYREDVLRVVISELVLVRNNLTSSKTITLAGDDLNPIPVTLIDITTDGSSTLTTTALNLTFSQAITGLTASDITLIGSSGLQKGTLNGSGPTYTLPISGFTRSENIAVSVAKPGYTIIGSPKTVTIHFIPFDQYVTRITFSGTEQTTTVNLINLYGNDIYLVKVNTSNLVVSTDSTGSVQDVSPSLNTYNKIMPNAFAIPDDALPIMGRPYDEQFLFPLPKPVVGESPLISHAATFIPPIVGSTRNFWVESAYGNRNFMQKSATLQATGNHGNIWVMDSSITTAQAQELSAKFDIIYPAVTNILGYEYGGKPGHAVPGGKDSDPKIQILVYDFTNAGGFFWSKDFYTDDQLSTGWRSNNAEIFYISASMVSNSPLYAYSALAHEFQHMINFNVKEVEKSVSSPTWYNEMLSLMTEDVIAELLNISYTNYQHPIGSRIPTFLGSYADEGVTEWSTLQSTSYAKGFAFGAYLLRNYGGSDLLRRILANNTVGIDSVTAALSEITPGLTFNEALLRYGEALIYSSPVPSGVMTYDKTVTNTINGISYSAFAFNVWNIWRSGEYGPFIYDLSQREMRPHSISLHSANAWKNRFGNYSVTLQKPTDPNVQLILMVK